MHANDTLQKLQRHTMNRNRPLPTQPIFQHSKPQDHIPVIPPPRVSNPYYFLK